MSKAEEATNDFCTRCFKYGKCHKVQSECTTADSYQEGYEDGYHQARKQLLSKSIDGVIAFDYYGNNNKTYGCIAHNSFCLEDFGLKDNDNVKMIIFE